MDLMKIVWRDVDRMHLPQDRIQWMALINTRMSLRVP
jgi:hypothetical protein